MKKYRKYIVLSICFCVVFGLDMLTKVIFEGKNMPFIKGIIGIYSCHNTGAAFSIFSDYPILLTILTSLLFVIIVVYFCLTSKPNIIYEISLSFIISGAFGNLIDRIIFGYVRDFINLEFVNFAVFNIADSALTIGIIGLMIFLLFLDKETLQKEQSK